MKNSRETSHLPILLHPHPLSLNTHDVTEDHFHTDLAFGFVTTEAPSLPIAEHESTDFRWVSKNELLALPRHLIFDNTREIYTFMFDEVLENWDRVDTREFLLEFPSDY